MSATNAISGISIVGAIVAGRRRTDSLLATMLGFDRRRRSATINVVGGFLITDRMLHMFKAAADRARTRDAMTARR